MKTDVHISDDYAVLSTEHPTKWYEDDESKISFYYGYEETKNDEWLFVAKKNGEIVQSYTTTELQKNVSSMDDIEGDMAKCLLVGINMYLNNL